MTTNTTEATEATEDHNPNAEAAKYRTKLRAAEEALQAITTQRDALARTVVEAHLPASISPKLFWQLHEGTEDLMGEDGTPDVDAITRAAGELTTQFGLTAPATAPVVPNIGDIPQGATQTIWQEVVRGQMEPNEA